MGRDRAAPAGEQHGEGPARTRPASAVDARSRSVPSGDRAAEQKPLFRIVFLDVDGVLHPANQKPGTFLARSMEALAKIVKSTDAKIVLSSAWRQSPARISLVNEALQKWGIGQVWSCTPVGGYETRGEEIDAWLREYVASGKTELDGMIAIDDEDLSYCLDRYGFPQPSRIKPYSLRTPADTGLTSPHVLRALSILQRRATLSPWSGLGGFSSAPTHRRELGVHRRASEPRQARGRSAVRARCGLEAAVAEQERALAVQRAS